MNYFFLTGDSSGIGSALAQIILQDESNILFGLSRRSREEKERFHPLQLDLIDQAQVDKFHFPDIKDADKIILVNNAGMLGPVKPLFEQNNKEIEQVYNLNTIAVAKLIAKFIQKYEDEELLIINISSGAANNAIQGWSTYCSSKSALDMLTSVLIEDLKFRNINNVQVYSVSPGVIDTPMQGAIRNSEKENFALHGQFFDLKTNNELVNPKTASELIYKIFSEPQFFGDRFINLRNHY